MVPGGCVIFKENKNHQKVYIFFFFLFKEFNEEPLWLEVSNPLSLGGTGGEGVGEQIPLPADRHSQTSRLIYWIGQGTTVLNTTMVLTNRETQHLTHNSHQFKVWLQIVPWSAVNSGLFLSYRVEKWVQITKKTCFFRPLRWPWLGPGRRYTTCISGVLWGGPGEGEGGYQWGCSLGEGILAVEATGLCLASATADLPGGNRVIREDFYIYIFFKWRWH